VSVTTLSVWSFELVFEVSVLQDEKIKKLKIMILKYFMMRFSIRSLIVIFEMKNRKLTLQWFINSKNHLYIKLAKYTFHFMIKCKVKIFRFN